MHRRLDTSSVAAHDDVFGVAEMRRRSHASPGRVVAADLGTDVALGIERERLDRAAPGLFAAG